MPFIASRPVHRARPGVVALLLVVVVAFATACTPEQNHILDLTNASRAEAGAPGLLPHGAAMPKAQSWAERLASEGTLRHSHLADGITGDWRSIAENVAYGPTIEVAYEAMMQSPSHRANILNPTFNFAGTGYAVGADGRVYIVQVFVEY